MKKRLNLFLFISFLLILILLVLLNFIFNKKINKTSYYPNSHYLIASFGKTLINNKKIDSLPYKITKGDIVETEENGGNLIVLQNGIELGLKNNPKVIFVNKNSLELINGELDVIKTNNEEFTLVWKDIKLIVNGKSDFRINNIQKEQYLELNNYKKDIKMVIMSNGEKQIIKPNYNYIIKEKGDISSEKLLKAPEKLSPQDMKNIGIEEGSNLFFKWDKVENAKEYILHIAYNSVFAAEETYKTKTNYYMINITDFKNSPVYWRVAAIDKKGIAGVMSKTNRFYIKNLIQILQLWKNPPHLKINDPLVPTGNLLIIKGKTDLGVKLTINGSDVTVDPNGKFMHIISFNTIGEHTITIISQNLSGAETRIIRKVIIYEK